MTRRHAVKTSITTVVAFALLAAAVSLATGGVGASTRPARARSERIEQALSTDRRLSAASDARRSGQLGQVAPIVAAAAPG